MTRRFGLLRRAVLLCGVFEAIGGAVGCAGAAPAPAAVPERRVGHVYIMRGLFNVFSAGVGGVCQRLRDNQIVDANDCSFDGAQRIVDTVVANRRKGDFEPIIIGGHSDGADNALRAAQLLADQGIAVDLVILIDDFVPPPAPRNIKKVLNIYTRKFGGTAVAPPSGRWTKEPVLEAFNVNPVAVPGVAQIFGQLQHFSIEKEGVVHDKIVAECLAICPPRSKWGGRRADGSDAPPDTKPTASAPGTKPTASAPGTKPAPTVREGFIDRRSSVPDLPGVPH